jgi:hypothetical protein
MFFMLINVLMPWIKEKALPHGLVTDKVKNVSPDRFHLNL